MKPNLVVFGCHVSSSFVIDTSDVLQGQSIANFGPHMTGCYPTCCIFLIALLQRLVKNTDMILTMRLVY